GRPPLRLPEAPWVVVVGFEDSDASVGWQVQQLLRELPPGRVTGVDVRAGATAGPLWQALAEATGQGARLGFKANLLPGAVAGFCREAERQAGGARLHAHAGSGIVRGLLDGDLTLAGARELLNGLAERAADARGNLTVPVCPAAWKE